MAIRSLTNANNSNKIQHMNNAIKTDRSVYTKDVYAVFDRSIDHYRTFAYTIAPHPKPLTRQEMNHMLVRSTIYNIPARVTCI